MKKPKIIFDISTTGKGGGPYTSTMNLVNSRLKKSYDFRIIEYKTEIGRFLSFRRILDLKRQIINEKPDIVHFTGLQLSGLHLAIACVLAGVKNRIVVIHGSSTEAHNISRFKKFIFFLIEALTLFLSSKFYAVSEYSSKLKVTNYFKKKNAGYIYNLITKEKPLNGWNKREDFGFTSNDIIVVTVARITKDKGYHILSEAIKDFENEKQIKFLIVGNGDYLDEMQSELQNQKNDKQVVFLGYQQEVMRILPICDIFVLPTLHETLSIALLEASNCSLPLIASNVGGVPEIIEHEYNGLLVPPGDKSELSYAIKKIARDKNLRIKYGSNARKKINNKFKDEDILNKISNLYKSILNN